MMKIQVLLTIKFMFVEEQVKIQDKYNHIKKKYNHIFFN